MLQLCVAVLLIVSISFVGLAVCLIIIFVGVGCARRSATVLLGSFQPSVELLWAPAQRKRATMLYFSNVFFLFFLWPPYSPALVNGGSRKFYTWWTLSVIREVSSWIFFWSSLNYRVGQKVTKFGVFSDRTRKLSALTPERGRIL